MRPDAHVIFLAVNNLQMIAWNQGQQIAVWNPLFKALFLRLQLGVVFADERLDLRRTCQDAEPLFFIQSDWKTAHAVQRDPPFLLTFKVRPPLSLLLSWAFSARRRSNSACISDSPSFPSADSPHTIHLAIFPARRFLTGTYRYGVSRLMPNARAFTRPDPAISDTMNAA